MSAESDEAIVERAKAEIRAEAARLDQRVLLERRAPPERPRPSDGGDGIEHARLDYRLGELTDLHHRAFAENAFRALLKRNPDERETAAQLALLARGATKAEVLGNLRYSPEGKRIGARVGGLLPRYATAKLRRVPLLGYAIDWTLTLAGLPLVVRHQRASEALFAAGDAAAAETDRALSARIDALDATGAAHRDWLGRLQGSADALADATIALRKRIEALESASSAQQGRLDELDFVRQRLYAINHWMHHLNLAFAEIETIAAQRDAELGASAASAAIAVAGADSERAARNAAWADALLTHMPEGGSVLALAGGGDWLELLAARGARVVGAESNERLAEPMRRAHIIVEPVSEREALNRRADASLDALSVLALPALMQRMSVIDLIVEAKRVLRPNGVLMLAFAREPASLADMLIARAGPTPEPELLAAALVGAGFSDIARADARDGSVALLAHIRAS